MIVTTEIERYERKFTALEAVEKIFEDEDVVNSASIDVVILPTENVDELTDMEDVCDDSIDTNNVHDVCGSVELQLDTDGFMESNILDKTSNEGFIVDRNTNIPGPQHQSQKRTN